MTDNVKIYTIDEFMGRLTGEQKRMVVRLRKIIADSVPAAEMMIMWSTPWYRLNNRPFAYIAAAQAGYVNLGYAFGAHLKSKLLEGTGKNMRHIKVRSMDQIDHQEKEYAALLKAAADLKK